MENTMNDIVVGLRSKIQSVISLYESSKAEKDKLAEEVNKLNKLIEEKNDKINELEKKINKLQLARTVLITSEDKHEAKLKVNRIVREIDKCIALLNR
ncbi:MAG: hypothetical protein ACOC2F_02015 [Bacteroidota bacterium]